MRRNQNCPRCERRLSLSPSGERDCQFCGIRLKWNTNEWEICLRRYQVDYVATAYLVIDVMTSGYAIKDDVTIIEANDALHAFFLATGINEQRVRTLINTGTGTTEILLRS